MMKRKDFFYAAMMISMLSGCTQEDALTMAPTSAGQAIHVIT